MAVAIGGFQDVVKELIAAGVCGRDLIDEVVYLTGLPAAEAMAVIIVETGGDIADAIGSESVA